MKLEFLEDLTDGGIYPDADPQNLVRIFDFDGGAAAALVATIRQVVLVQRQALDISALDFVEAVNCTLCFRIGDKDLGIIRDGASTRFHCDLTMAGYEWMLSLMEPFVAGGNGYSWLADTAYNDVDLLFSPGGTW